MSSVLFHCTGAYIIQCWVRPRTFTFYQGACFLIPRMSAGLGYITACQATQMATQRLHSVGSFQILSLRDVEIRAFAPVRVDMDFPSVQTLTPLQTEQVVRPTGLPSYSLKWGSQHSIQMALYIMGFTRQKGGKNTYRMVDSHPCHRHLWPWFLAIHWYSGLFFLRGFFDLFQHRFLYNGHPQPGQAKPRNLTTLPSCSKAACRMGLERTIL